MNWVEVRDESGNVCGRYAVLPYDSEAYHRAQRAEIDALEAGRASEGTFALYLSALNQQGNRNGY